MTTAADDVADYLEDEGVGTIAGTDSGEWAIYVGEEPVRPDNVITVYDTGGLMGLPDANMQDPTIQISFRSHDYDAATAKGAEIRDLLALPTSRTIGEWFYTGFWLISDIAKIGKDDNGRHLFTLNFRLMREPA